MSARRPGSSESPIGAASKTGHLTVIVSQRTAYMRGDAFTLRGFPGLPACGLGEVRRHAGCGSGTRAAAYTADRRERHVRHHDRTTSSRPDALANVPTHEDRRSGGRRSPRHDARSRARRWCGRSGLRQRGSGCWSATSRRRPGARSTFTYSRWNKPVRVHAPLDFIDSETGQDLGHGRLSSSSGTVGTNGRPPVFPAAHARHSPIAGRRPTPHAGSGVGSPDRIGYRRRGRGRRRRAGSRRRRQSPRRPAHRASSGSPPSSPRASSRRDPRRRQPRRRPRASASRETVASAPETAALLRGIPQHGTSSARPTAPVKLVEYADLQCVYCGAWAATSSRRSSPLRPHREGAARVPRAGVRRRRLRDGAPHRARAPRAEPALERRRAPLPQPGRREQRLGQRPTSSRAALEAVPGLDVRARSRPATAPRHGARRQAEARRRARRERERHADVRDRHAGRVARRSRSRRSTCPRSPRRSTAARGMSTRTPRFAIAALSSRRDRDHELPALHALQRHPHRLPDRRLRDVQHRATRSSPASRSPCSGSPASRPARDDGSCRPSGHGRPR